MREIIEKVKDSTSIESIVGETVSLKRSGAKLKGYCPLHNEKTPSFFVRPSAQTFHCFGCGKSGDVLQFEFTPIYIGVNSKHWLEGGG